MLNNLYITKDQPIINQWNFHHSLIVQVFSFPIILTIIKQKLNLLPIHTKNYTTFYAQFKVADYDPRRRIQSFFSKKTNDNLYTFSRIKHKHASRERKNYSELLKNDRTKLQ